VPWRPGGLPQDRRHWDAWTVEVAWPTHGEHVGVRDAVFRNHVYEHRYRDEWWLRPALNPEGDYLLPLMTWWVLLFGLSMHARYHPAEWTAALRVDRHDETVPLEAAMDAALSAIPHYVLDALHGMPVSDLR
jgi:YaaC-like protein